MMNKERVKKERVKFEFESAGILTFYVKFYDEKDQEEFQKIIKAFKKRSEVPEIYVSNIAGTYEVMSLIEESTQWNILMRKYLAMSNEVRIDGQARKYFPVRFSDSYISPWIAKKFAEVA